MYNAFFLAITLYQVEETTTNNVKVNWFFINSMLNNFSIVVQKINFVIFVLIF